ncbi:MAG: hemerythrin domain-containing protein [Ectobacillus sp.]
MSNGCHFSQLAANGQTLSPALQQLKDEHIPLNEQKYELFQLATAIREETYTTAPIEQLSLLREKVLAFLAVLDPHSKREEDILFEMMVQYIGREMGPIAVMEYEHDQAKANISMFLEQTKELQTDISKETAAQLAAYISNAYSILTDHFMKEEQVLFPMAEQMLSVNEKEELLQKINEI